MQRRGEENVGYQHSIDDDSVYDSPPSEGFSSTRTSPFFVPNASVGIVSSSPAPRTSFSSSSVLKSYGKNTPGQTFKSQATSTPGVHYMSRPVSTIEMGHTRGNAPSRGSPVPSTGRRQRQNPPQSHLAGERQTNTVNRNIAFVENRPADLKAVRVIQQEKKPPNTFLALALVSMLFNIITGTCAVAIALHSRSLIRRGRLEAARSDGRLVVSLAIGSIAVTPICALYVWLAYFA